MEGMPMRTRVKSIHDDLERDMFRIGSDRQLHLKDTKARKIQKYVEVRGM